MKIHVSVEIAADSRRVIDAFRDLDNLASRVDGIDCIERTDGPAFMGLGSCWLETRTLFGKTRTERRHVSAFSTPHYFKIVAASHGIQFASHYVFTAVGETQTRVGLMFVGHPVSFGARLESVFWKLFKSVAKKVLMADLRSLRDSIERDLVSERREVTSAHNA